MYNKSSGSHLSEQDIAVLTQFAFGTATRNTTKRFKTWIHTTNAKSHIAERRKNYEISNIDSQIRKYDESLNKERDKEIEEHLKDIEIGHHAPYVLNPTVNNSEINILSTSSTVNDNKGDTSLSHAMSTRTTNIYYADTPRLMDIDNDPFGCALDENSESLIMETINNAIIHQKEDTFATSQTYLYIKKRDKSDYTFNAIDTGGLGNKHSSVHSSINEEYLYEIHYLVETIKPLNLSNTSWSLLSIILMYFIRLTLKNKRAKSNDHIDITEISANIASIIPSNWCDELRTEI